VQSRSLAPRIPRAAPFAASLAASFLVAGLLAPSALAQENTLVGRAVLPAGSFQAGPTADPDHQIPFAITNFFTKSRVLTGADFDLESMQVAPDGTLWFGAS
jgi:hypothetical protein